MLRVARKNPCVSFRLILLAALALLLASCSGAGPARPAAPSPVLPTPTSAPAATQTPAAASMEDPTRPAEPTPITFYQPVEPAVPPLEVGPNLLQNPGFEADFNGWFRGDDPVGASTEVDAAVRHDGAKSLRITFDVSADVDYWHVSQDVPVEASATYRLDAYLRVSDIRAFSSARLAAQDARGPDLFTYSTPDLYATQDWTPVSLTFTTLPDTRTVRLVVLRSSANGKFPISGSAWVDDVSLVRLPPLIAPAQLTLRSGAAQEVAVSNGTPPYSWTSSSSAVAAVQPAADTTHARLTAQSAGEATITAVDAIGRTGVLRLTTVEQSVITVETRHILREVPAAMFGSNVSYHVTKEYMPDHLTWDTVINDPRFIADVADLGLDSLRFPGGQEANYYDFSTGKGYVGWMGGSAQYNAVNGISAEQFIRFLRGTGIPNAMITANIYKSGNKNLLVDNWISPQVAADWVAYTNQTLGFHVTYWELGNEVTASDAYPWITDPQAVDVQVPGLTRDLYIQKVGEWSRAMKAVDPAIKIGAVVLESPRRGGLAEWWTLPVIQQRADDIDFVIVHPYVGVSAYLEGGKVTDRAVQEANAWMKVTHPIRDLRGLLNTFAPARASSIEIQASEWGVIANRTEMQDTDTLWNAVLNTDSLWDMVQEGADGANIWNLCDFPYQSMDAASGGQKYAQYHMLWMNRHHSGQWLLESQVSAPTYSAGPFGSYATMDYVAAVDGVPYLSAYATLSADQRTLYLIVTNKSAEDQLTTIQLNDFTPARRASLWQMTSPRWDDTGVTPLTADILNAAASFSYAFPARSVTSFVFDAQ